MVDETPMIQHDQDPQETSEWLAALEAVLREAGTDRAQFLLSQLHKHAQQAGLQMTTTSGLTTPYCNTIASDQQVALPDDPELIFKLLDIHRWNATMMVLRAGIIDESLGGHVSTYASIALLYEMGLNYFFQGSENGQTGDLVYFQGHSSTGIYARAFLEGRLSTEQLNHYRQECEGRGLSSYPHPWLMPKFWQFPTVSMGLGPLMGIYQAYFLGYLQDRGLSKHPQRRVFVFCGDGEMDEPESTGALSFAGREKLDHLTFIINCNLQRLDGPVRGNGQIMQEFESLFSGAGWHVIKVIWGSGWDDLLARDKTGLLQKRMNELLDGEYQNYAAKGPEYLREHFFGRYPELAELVADMTDAQLAQLQDGGHDPIKVYNAYRAALAHTGQPTVILMKTVKGYRMGSAVQALNVAHNTKKMSHDAVLALRDSCKIPLSDAAAESHDYYKPAAKSAEMQYLHNCRKKLGGALPVRADRCEKLVVADLQKLFAAQLQGSAERSISTTMALGRMIASLLKDPVLKDRLVPIIPDETRTFGMEGLFRQIGIYASQGQKYEPEDKHLLMYYRESQQGQLLQAGINEAGAMCEWISAATAYSHSGIAMIPIYIYYAMFGFQRFGDLVWAAGDMMARGFIVGGLSGRTALAGEGLQHQDAHNILMYDYVPNCYTYDVCFAYEMAVIVHQGLKHMYEQQANVFYYLTAMNENYLHPPMPAGAEPGIIKGLYLLQAAENKNSSVEKSNKKIKKQNSLLHVQLLGAGAILRECLAAVELLAEFGIDADVWGVTSFNLLRRDYEATVRSNRLQGLVGDAQQLSYVAQCLLDFPGPVIAASDQLKVYAEQIRGALPRPFYALGTNGFGRSDTRAALREFFEVNANMIAYTAIYALFEQGQLSKTIVDKAKQRFAVDAHKRDPHSY